MDYLTNDLWISDYLEGGRSYHLMPSTNVNFIVNHSSLMSQVLSCKPHNLIQERVCWKAVGNLTVTMLNNQPFRKRVGSR